MNTRIYGVIGISAIMANWNADFTGNPKSISDGSIFGSDKALKYPMKKMWENEGEKVFYIKSMKISDGKDDIQVLPRSLKERYEQLFCVENLKEVKNTKEIIENLFSTIDVKNFGATFAEEGNNISITGAVQIGQGFNKYAATQTEEQQILSPFRSNRKAKADDDTKEAKNSSIGTKIVSDEAHYFYPFTINPLAYKNYVDLGVTEGYTEADYLKFKNAALCAATAYATNAKIGCSNEFALFVETKQDAYMPNLDAYISFKKAKEINVIELLCSDILNNMSEKIKAIEIYYNPYNTEIEGKIEGAKLYNIFTLKEV